MYNKYFNDMKFSQYNNHSHHPNGAIDTYLYDSNNAYSYTDNYKIDKCYHNGVYYEFFPNGKIKKLVDNKKNKTFKYNKFGNIEETVDGGTDEYTIMSQFKSRVNTWYTIQSKDTDPYTGYPIYKTIYKNPNN